MTRENGTIKDNVAKIIDRNLDENGNLTASRGLIPYDTPTVFDNDAKVSFDVIDDGLGNVFATNVVLLPTRIDPDMPVDEGDVKNTDIAGDLSINGNTVTLKGVVVSGNVNMKGGKLILKPDDAGRRSKILGSLDGKNNQRVIIYKSDIIGGIDFKDGLTLTITEGTANNIDIKKSQEISLLRTKISTGLDGKNNQRIIISDSEINGNIDVKNNTESVSIIRTKISMGLDGKNNQRIVIDTAISGNDITLKGNKFASVQNSTISGDLRFIENTDCCQKNNTVSGINSGCAKICQ